MGYEACLMTLGTTCNLGVQPAIVCMVDPFFPAPLTHQYDLMGFNDTTAGSHFFHLFLSF
jgi:hypothetical protein